MLDALADHLWQSTLFGAAAALVAVLLKGAPARFRHGVWLAASLKFLVPFGWMTAAGHRLGWTTLVTVHPDVITLVEALGQPFTAGPEMVTPMASASGLAGPGGPAFNQWAAAAAAIWLAGTLVLIGRWVAQWRRLRGVVRASERSETGRERRLLDAMARSLRAPAVPLHLTDAPLEPGVFGIWRPVLLWPRRIGERLSDQHMSAILAHELSHVRRRDNASAVIVMAVRALFWFHPLVAWVERRLLAERERSCDEEVIRHGGEPQAYAEGLLRTCAFCVESSLPCVAGVTGAELTGRIAAIMRPAAPEPAGWHRMMLGTCGVAAIGGPLALGLLAAPRTQQIVVSMPAHAGWPAILSTEVRFDTAEIRRSSEADPRHVTLLFQPDGEFIATNVTARMLIAAAYGQRLPLPAARLGGGPDWLDRDRFTIAATTTRREPSGYGGPPAFMFGMLRQLLRDRFALRLHTERREGETYALVMARADGRPGPALKRSPIDCAARAAAPGVGLLPMTPDRVPPCAARIAPGRLTARALNLGEWAARDLSRIAGRLVQNRTGLDGAFDIDLAWAPGSSDRGIAGASAGDEASAAFAAALEQQLGLRLAPSRDIVDMFIVDNAEAPATTAH